MRHILSDSYMFGCFLFFENTEILESFRLRWETNCKNMSSDIVQNLRIWDPGNLGTQIFICSPRLSSLNLSNKYYFFKKKSLTKFWNISKKVPKLNNSMLFSRKISFSKHSVDIFPVIENSKVLPF